MPRSARRLGASLLGRLGSGVHCAREFVLVALWAPPTLGVSTVCMLIGQNIGEKRVSACAHMLNENGHVRTEINENGHAWVRHESPRADIRRGWNYKLIEASGDPPDAIWNGFKHILIDFGSKRGRQNLPLFPYISL